MTLEYKDTTIYFESHGQGQPLIALHGFLENSSMWDALLPALSHQYQMITMDLLGHGKTACKGYIHTMEDMASAVAQVLSFLRLKSAHLLGHSMGGYVALAFAELFPDRLSGLTLLNSTAKADSEERKQNRDRGIKVVKQNPQAYTGMAISNLFASENREHFAAQIIKIKKEASKTPLQGIIAAQEGMKIRKDRTEVLQKIKCRKMMIAGKKDPILPCNDLEKEAQEHQLQFIPLEGGHMSHIENLEPLLEILKTI